MPIVPQQVVDEYRALVGNVDDALGQVLSELREEIPVRIQRAMDAARPEPQAWAVDYFGPRLANNAAETQALAEARNSLRAAWDAAAKAERGVPGLDQMIATSKRGRADHAGG